MIDFTLSKKQRALKEGLAQLGRHVVRPMSLEADRRGEFPEEFLRNFLRLASAFRGGDEARALGTGAEAGGAKGPSDAHRTAVVGAEELAHADAALLLCVPGPGLGAPPVRASGTPEQKARFFGAFEGMEEGELRWGAYALTEPGAGSDVAAIRTTCRKEGRAWVLDGRKCFITNGARASWIVVFATVDPSRGRAGHRAFLVERGSLGLSVGKIEDKMGLRASETAELVFEGCRVPEENLLGGEGSYADKEGFTTAMKTFDGTRPLVAAMACGIGRAAYEYARDFVRERYVLSRPVPRYAALAERLARAGRRLEAARALVHRAAYLADVGAPNAKEASMAKAYAAEAAMAACVDAIEICGAHGSLRGEHDLLEKWFRDIVVFDIFEGTGHIQRIVVAKRLLPSLKSF